MARNAIGLPGPPKILFQHNVESEIYRRHADSDLHWLRRAYMGLQCRKMRAFEARAGRRFDAVIAVSERDREIFEREYGWQHVHTIDTAVDIEYFQACGTAPKRKNVVFLGSMDWLPNSDGAAHFAHSIWPNIRQSHPDATFTIVGRNPTPMVSRLASLSGITVTDTVPDVRPYLQTASVVVVPLLVGGGTRIKIFEAMAASRPVVSTTLAAA